MRSAPTYNLPNLVDTNKQTRKQASKQASKQTNTRTHTHTHLLIITEQFSRHGRLYMLRRMHSWAAHVFALFLTSWNTSDKLPATHGAGPGVPGAAAVC